MLQKFVCYMCCINYFLVCLDFLIFFHGKFWKFYCGRSWWLLSFVSCLSKPIPLQDYKFLKICYFYGFIVRFTSLSHLQLILVKWHPTPVFLPGKSHGRRSLVGCSPWGRDESDTTERLHFHFSLSCIGEGNGNPLQCSCLENPRDGGAWWAAVYGVTQSRT